VARIGERAGYSGISPLTLRHSRAIYLLDSGIPVHRTAALLGCSYEVLERHYAQIEEARL
jgi:site-specific recombinase XerD